MSSKDYSGFSAADEVVAFNKNLRKFSNAREYIENLGLADLNSLDKNLMSSFDPNVDLAPVSMFTCEVDYDNRLIPGIFVTVLGFSKQFSGRALLKRVETYVNFREGIKQRITLLVNEKIPEFEEIEVDVEDVPLNPPPSTYTPGNPDDPNNPDIPIGTPWYKVYDLCVDVDRQAIGGMTWDLMPEKYQQYRDSEERMKLRLKDPAKAAQLDKELEEKSREVYSSINIQNKLYQQTKEEYFYNDHLKIKTPSQQPKDAANSGFKTYQDQPTISTKYLK